MGTAGYGQTGGLVNEHGLDGIVLSQTPAGQFVNVLRSIPFALQRKN